MQEIDTDSGQTASELPPSKSARKRAAHAAQKLGEQLVRMREQEVSQLPLPEELRDAIAEARRLTHRGALARQLQYIGKLMREVDMEAVESTLAARADAHRARARLRR
jgi:ribosome-associated protein